MFGQNLDIENHGFIWCKKIILLPAPSEMTHVVSHVPQNAMRAPRCLLMTAVPQVCDLVNIRMSVDPQFSPKNNILLSDLVTLE